MVWLIVVFFYYLCMMYKPGKLHGKSKSSVCCSGNYPVPSRNRDCNGLSYLPQGIQEKGRRFGLHASFWLCQRTANQLHEVIRLSGMNLIINETDHPLIIKVASIQSARMQVYFIDNEDYFGRKQTFRRIMEHFSPTTMNVRCFMPAESSKRYGNCVGTRTSFIVTDGLPFGSYVCEEVFQRRSDFFPKHGLCTSLSGFLCRAVCPGFAHKAHLEGVSKKDCQPSRRRII
jgi:hypothetical protein